MHTKFDLLRLDLVFTSIRQVYWEHFIADEFVFAWVDLTLGQMNIANERVCGMNPGLLYVGHLVNDIRTNVYSAISFHIYRIQFFSQHYEQFCIYTNVHSFIFSRSNWIPSIAYQTYCNTIESNRYIDGKKSSIYSTRSHLVWKSSFALESCAHHGRTRNRSCIRRCRHCISPGFFSRSSLLCAFIRETFYVINVCKNGLNTIHT